MFKADGAKSFFVFFQRAGTNTQTRTQTHAHSHVKYFLLLLTFSCHDEDVMSACDSPQSCLP